MVSASNISAQQHPRVETTCRRPTELTSKQEE